MKRVIFAAMLLSSTAAFADPPKEYTFTVTTAEANAIGVALGQRPFTEVRELMQKLEAQVTVQNQPKPQTPVETPKADETPKQ